MLSNAGFFKKTSEFGFKSISHSIKNNVKLNFFKFLNDKKAIYNPKKLKIKEFENLFLEKIEYINSFLRKSSFEIKRTSLNSETSNQKLFEKLQETVYSSSLASKCTCYVTQRQ
jgi:hypothetical protein